MASCTDGIAPSDPPRTRPRRDMAKAFAAVHKRATSANVSTILSALRPATHLLPTSAPSTGSRALPPSPASSGYVSSLRRLCLAWLSHPGGVGTPSLCRWQAGCHRGEGDRQPQPQDACHPTACALPNPCRARTNSPELWLLLLCRPLPQRTPAPNTCAPTRPLLRKLHGGGQGRRVDGHTGSCEQTGEGADEACEEGANGKEQGRTLTSCQR